LLNDADIFTDSSLEIMKRILDYGGKATCTQLAIKYGESKNFYNSGSSALARRIVNKTNCPIMSWDNDESKWWTVLYVGKGDWNSAETRSLPGVHKPSGGTPGNARED